MKSSDRQRFSLIAIWIFLTMVLHLGWEVIQLPFYSLWSNGNYKTISNAVLHCTFGDGLISVAVWLVVATLLRNGRWLFTDFLRGYSIAWPLGLLYTVWSEWHNVYVLGSWQYADPMPTIAGIGLLPLLQWGLIPPITWILIHFVARRISKPQISVPYS